MLGTVPTLSPTDFQKDMRLNCFMVYLLNSVNLLRVYEQQPIWTEGIQLMKNRLFSILIVLFTILTSLINSFAQNYTKLGLPEGAKTRIGKGGITGMRYSPDGTRLAVDTTIGIWIYDAKAYEELAFFGESNSQYYGNRRIFFSPDGNTLASTRGSREGIKLWDVTTGRLKNTLVESLISVGYTVLFSPNGRTLASNNNKEIYLWDTVTGDYEVLKGHTDYVRRFAFSPDGKTLASGSSDHTVRLWNVATGEHKKNLTGHPAPVTRIAFSPDGSTLTSVSDDKTVYLWDISTGERKKTLASQGVISEQVEKEEIIERLFFSPDGSTLATVRFNNTIRLWDTTTGSLKQTFISQGTDRKQTDYNKKIQTVLFSPDKRTVISLTGGGLIRLWDIATGKHKQFSDRTRFLRNVCLSADGKILATAGMNHTIHLWDTSSGKHKESIIGYYHRNSMHLMGDYGGIALSPDGSKVAGINNTIFLCDTSTGRHQSLVTENQKVIYYWDNNILFSPNSDILAIVSSKGIIRLWDANTGKYKHTLITQRETKDQVSHPKPISGISFSPDGRTLANVSIDKNIYLWNTTTGRLKGTIKGHADKVNSVSFSPDGKTLVSGSQDGTLRMWDVGTRKLKQTITNQRATDNGKSSSAPVSTVSFRSDGATLASGSQNGSIYLWDVETAKQKGIFKGHADAISSITFGPDGLTFASTSVDGSIRLWDVETGQQKQAIAGYKKTNWCVFFYPNGLVLASKAINEPGSIGHENVHLWDLVTGERKKVLSGHTQNVSSISFSADGKTLVSGSGDGTVLVWDIPSIISAIDFSE